MPSEAEWQNKPPAACHTDFQAGVDLVAQEAKDYLVHYGVPWAVTSKLGTEGWTTVQLITDRWKDVNDLLANAPTALGFDPGTHGYDDNKTRPQHQQ